MTDTEREQMAAYTMPKPKIGQPVIYYHGGTIHAGNADLAYVVEIGDTCIGLSHRGIRYEGIRHIDDPRTKRGRDHRKPGLWCFTDADLETQARLAELEQRIAVLEFMVASDAKARGPEPVTEETQPPQPAKPAKQKARASAGK